MRWLWWLLPPWGRSARRQDWLAVSAALAEAEQRAALARMMGQATRPYPNVRAAPLMTRGQQSRANRGPR